MQPGSDGSQGTGATESGGGSVTTQLALLVPSFDPSKDDLLLYHQKVQMVYAVWPQTKVSELITRLILNTSGTAFAKLQLHYAELCVNDEKGIKRLIELLGGHWDWRRDTLTQSEPSISVTNKMMRAMTVIWHEQTCCGRV